ncbi:MAG: ABC transporter permease [Acidobacteriota bacterium]|nr:ABC transporter permease [Acidobacteriota bacterium]
MKAYLALIRIELKLALRNRSALFFNYMFPLIFFFIFAQAFHAEQGGAILQVVAMVATIGVIGNGLFGAGMRAVQEREQNILRRYKVTPISPAPLLTSSIVTGLILYLPYIALMLFLANRIYHMPVPEHLISMFVFVAFGTVAFRSIGLIIASVVNSMQESVILVQILYFVMLFLSGASFPISIFPTWLQNLSQFIPATYLVSGLQGILLRHESILQNAAPVLALVITTVVALFVSTKIFRWEKEEKIRSSAKLWILAVMVPFFLIGIYQAYSKENLEKSRIDMRVLRRSRTLLYRNARIFIGDGKVIESGSVLVRNGKIADVFEGPGPDPKTLNAEPLEAAGKTILPGLIDVHVHLVAPGGIADQSYRPDAKTFERDLAAYLFSGVTAVKSAGDPENIALEARKMVNSGQRLGAEFFICGPLFTAASGHGTEYFKQLPEAIRAQAMAAFTRIPKSPEEARRQVDALKKDGVDGIKAVLQGGVAGYAFNRLDIGLLNAIGAESRAQNLPLTVHTGEARDVADAVDARTNGIEHGSFRDRIPPELFARMAREGIYYDPTLSAFEGFQQLSDRKMDLFNRSLVQQTTPKNILANTRKVLSSPPGAPAFEMNLQYARANLVAAWKAGVPLVTGSDAGNPLVFHGPTVQREVELWVEAGIPPAVALQAATLNASRFLRAENRFGMIRKGLDATMLIVDGNPLQDIRAIENISSVMFKGERIDRSELFDQE